MATQNSRGMLHSNNKIGSSNMRISCLLSKCLCIRIMLGDVKKVRENMDQLDIHKQPGCSPIEISEVLHEFLWKDHSYYASNDIYHGTMELLRTQILFGERNFKDDTMNWQAALHEALSLNVI